MSKQFADTVNNDAKRVHTVTVTNTAAKKTHLTKKGPSDGGGVVASSTSVGPNENVMALFR